MSKLSKVKLLSNKDDDEFAKLVIYSMHFIERVAGRPLPPKFEKDFIQGFYDGLSEQGRKEVLA